MQPSGNNAQERRARRRLTVIVFGSSLGLFFPFVFLTAVLLLNLGTVSQALPMLISLIIAGALPYVVYLFAAERLFRRLSEFWIHLFMILWGLINLALTYWLILNTGGIRSTIFGWLFEYILVVTLVIRPIHIPGSDFGRRFRQGRAVLGTAVLELSIIVLLVLKDRRNDVPPFEVSGLTYWVAGSLASALIFTYLLFFLNDVVRREVQ